MAASGLRSDRYGQDLVSRSSHQDLDRITAEAARYRPSVRR